MKTNTDTNTIHAGGKVAPSVRLPKNCRLFSDIPEEDLPNALAFFCAEQAFFPRGSFLQKAGMPVHHFGLLLSGALQVFTDDVEGQRMLMANVLPGETYGESLCYLHKQDSPVYVEALEDSFVLLLSPKRLFAPAACSPLEEMLICRFTAMLATKMLHMNDRVQILSKRTLRKKLLAFFTQCVREAGGTREFTIPFDRERLAAYLGADRAALSRELSSMQKEGLIRFSRSHFVLLCMPDTTH